MANSFGIPHAFRLMLLDIMSDLRVRLGCLQSICSHHAAYYCYDPSVDGDYSMACPECGMVTRLKFVATPANWSGSSEALQAYHDAVAKIRREDPCALAPFAPQ